MSLVNMEAPPSSVEVIQEREEYRETDEAQKLTDPPLSRCKGRKKRPTRYIPAIEANVKKKEGHVVIVTPNKLIIYEHVLRYMSFIPFLLIIFI
jgi:hypothetical protein